MSGVVAFIPARLGSTRFPGKVLASQTGRPLIQHVYESVRGAASLSRVVIATDDQRVVDAAATFGAEAVMTGPEHPNGTSRIAEAAAKLGLADDQIVVNVQGDEPELDPGAIDAAVAALMRREKDAGAMMGTVASPMDAAHDAGDPNIVKVLLDQRGCALYFSRAKVPFDRDQRGGVHFLRHIGLYAYRRRFLDQYVRLTATPLEQAEQLEQLRVLEHGHRIAVAEYATRHVGIDTPEQYAAFVERWRCRGR